MLTLIGDGHLIHSRLKHHGVLEANGTGATLIPAEVTAGAHKQLQGRHGLLRPGVSGLRLHLHNLAAHDLLAGRGVRRLARIPLHHRARQVDARLAHLPLRRRHHRLRQLSGERVARVRILIHPLDQGHPLVPVLCKN